MQVLPSLTKELDSRMEILYYVSVHHPRLNQPEPVHVLLLLGSIHEHIHIMRGGTIMKTRRITRYVWSALCLLVVVSPRTASGQIGSSSHPHNDVIMRPASPLSVDETTCRIGPSSLDPDVLDTLSWKTLPFSSASLSSSNPGESLAVWFVPAGACTLEAIRIHFVGGPCGTGNILLDVCGTRYDGHIRTTDSTDVNGWIGDSEGGVWNPGWTLGYSPVGEHIWGPFPLSMDGSMLSTWVEISTAQIWGRPNMTGDPFCITMACYPVDKSICVTMENQNVVPFHLFKYYAECCGPDGVHKGWFIRSFSIWIEAIVSYYENTPPEITDMDVVNYTYRPGPFSVRAEIEDEDAEDPGRAGVAVVSLHWNINGVSDSTTMSGPTGGGMFAGHIPSIAVGDTVRYYIRAVDHAGMASSSMIQTFARLTPVNPHADLLLVSYEHEQQYGSLDQSLFYRQLLDSLEYTYEYWNIGRYQGIDESVAFHGWRTAIIFGFPVFLPFSLIDPPLPARDYADNIWAEFLREGTEMSPANLFYAEKEYWDLNQESEELIFQPGDFAYDYLGCLAANECDAFACTDKVFHGFPGDPVTGVFAEDPFRQTWPLSFAQVYWMTYTTAAENGADVFITETGNKTGLRCDGSTFKTVFFPWDFTTLLEESGVDTIPSEDVRLLMGKVLEWFGTESELMRGDINDDNQINVLDVLLGANIILGIHDPTDAEYVRADCNGDRQVDVIDLVGFVNIILEIGSCPP